MRMLVTLTLVGLLAVPVAAQQQGHRHRGHMGQQMRPMGMQGMMGMMGMHAGPGMVLRLAEPLGLSDAQVEQIQVIRDETQDAMQQHMRQAMQAMQGVAELLTDEAPDLDAYQDRLDEAADHGVLAHMARTRAMVRVREILTAEQREELATGMGMMVHMMQNRAGMMQGMMMPGMMRGMMMPGMMRGMMGTMVPDTSGMH